MSIEIGSKWVKDLEVVIIENLGNFCSNKVIRNFSGISDVVQFRQCNSSVIEIMYISKFLEQYNPYEPVYEWEFVAQQPDGVRHFTHFMTDKEIEFFSFQNDCAYYQRLDFTKRERKQ